MEFRHMSRKATTDSGRSWAIADPTAEGRRGHASQRVRLVMDAFWRRRLLIFLPLLFIGPLSYIVSNFLPSKFATRALVLVQPADPRNPLVIRTGDGDQIQERIAGYRTLLKSDRVLGGVVEEINKGLVLSPIERNLQIGNLRSAIDVVNAGNNLLEFKLVGNKPDGLALQLTQILKQFYTTYQTSSPFQTPDRVITIDPPQDPVAPIRSRLIYVLVASLGALTFGVTCAAIIERFDDRVRTLNELERLSDAKVVGIMRVKQVESRDG